MKNLMFVFSLLFVTCGWAYRWSAELPPPWNKEPENFRFQEISLKYAEIGEKLFFDPILSRNKKISCGTCHQPQFSFSNGSEKGRGVNGKLGIYNVPVLFNRAGSEKQFWDGRVSSLENQIFHPIQDAEEMGMTEQLALQRLNESTYYREKFGEQITKNSVEKALSHFIRSLVSGGSRYDRFLGGDANALKADELEGKKLFFEKYRCDKCHAGPNFTNEQLSGRCGTEEKATDTAKYGQSYKVPTLRNLATSAPYFHNGKLRTLMDVLEFYDRPAGDGIAGRITKEEKEKIVKFLETLNGEIIFYKKQVP